MGKIQEMETAAARRTLSLATRSEIDPVTQRLDHLGTNLEMMAGQLAQMLAAMDGFVARMETGEDTRAERLRQTVDPVLQSTQTAADRTVIAILSHSARLESMEQAIEILRQDLEKGRFTAKAAALSQQMGVLAQEMAKLPAAIAAHLVQATERPPSNRGIAGSGGPVLNGDAIEQLQDKARAYDILEQWHANRPEGQRALAKALGEAKANRMTRR